MYLNEKYEYRYGDMKSNCNNDNKTEFGCLPLVTLFLFISITILVFDDQS